MTADDYLAWERAQTDKHEFFRGEVFAMAGGSVRHNALSGRVLRALATALEPRGCVVLTSDQRVQGADDHYVYPDVTVLCGPPELTKHDVLANPTALVEVLSSTTEQYDRGLKWEGYQRLAALQDYVLVSQAEPRIELFRRGADGTWIYQAAGAGQQLTLRSGAVLDVDAIFAGTADITSAEGSGAEPAGT